VGHREKISSFECGCNSEWLPRLELFESTNKYKETFTVNFTFIVIRCLSDLFFAQK
jgi:hypothetical protein